MLPQDALDWLRSVFDRVDRETSFRLSTVPHSHEPALDQLFISALQGVAPFVVTPSATTVWIETHFLGGRAMFYSWEVADIGMLFIFRVRGEYKFTKVALFQSKRLYPIEVSSPDDMDLAYRVGFGRIFPSNEKYAAMAQPRLFSFDDNSKYLALSNGDNQISVIRQYQAQRRVPVCYLFYNPFKLPWTVLVPSVAPAALGGNVEVGTRIVPSTVVFDVCEQLSASESPSVGAISAKLAERSFPHKYGWSLSEYVVDNVLQCREGRVVDPTKSEDLFELFYGRTGPISAAVAVTIDVEEDDFLPDGEWRQLPQ